MSNLSRSFMDLGVCREMPEDERDLFYPEPENFDTAAQFEMAVNAAKVACARCTVTPECLAYALATGEQFGIWGGRTDVERAQILASAASSA